MRSMFLYRMHYKSINSVFQGRFEVSIYLAVATLIVNTESHKQPNDGTDSVNTAFLRVGLFRLDYYQMCRI